MDYGNVLQRSWEILWKHKVLWLFGILAGCGSSGGFSNSLQWRGGGQRPGAPMPPWMRGLERWFGHLTQVQVILLVAALFLLSIGLMLFLTALRSVGVAGLVRGAALADDGQTFTLSTLFERIRPQVLPLFGLNLLLSLAVVLVFMVLMAFWFGVTLLTFGLGILCLFPLLCLLIPLAMLFAVFVAQAEIALVLEERGVLEALRRGWEVLRDHPGEYLIMGLILLVAMSVVGLLLALPMIVVLFPAMLSLASGEHTGLWLAGLCLVVYLPVWLVLSGMVQTYLYSAWTLTYRTLNLPPAPAGEVRDYVEPLAA